MMHRIQTQTQEKLPFTNSEQQPWSASSRPGVDNSKHVPHGYAVPSCVNATVQPAPATVYVSPEKPVRRPWERGKHPGRRHEPEFTTKLVSSFDGALNVIAIDKPVEAVLSPVTATVTDRITRFGKLSNAYSTSEARVVDDTSKGRVVHFMPYTSWYVMVNSPNKLLVLKSLEFSSV